jgi:hypothetical protein
MFKKLVCVFVLIISVSCTKEKAIVNADNLQEYLNLNSGLATDEIIACAASDEFNTSISYIFYYPATDATNIQYFETESSSEDENIFSNYKKRALPKEGVFNGYLERFVRDDQKEVWSIVTFKTNGKLHKSNPIRLKHQTKPTEWSNQVAIDFTQNTSPKFLWKDGVVKENAIYFQVLTDQNNNLLSGTYTYDFWFQYYVLDNVVLNITKNAPPILVEGNNYHFTMMGVSIDNWVNLVVQKQLLI